MTGISVAAAGAAGIVSFLSPRVLPLVPGYLSYLSGIAPPVPQSSVASVSSSPVAPPAASPAAPRGRQLARVLGHATAFVLGFTTVFVMLGASATLVGRVLAVHGNAFAVTAGVLIIVFGLHILGVLRIPLLYREKRLQPQRRPRMLLGSYAIGMAFAFGWTPCIGPILAGVLGLAATRGTVLQGVELLIVYSLGLGLPFLLAAIGMGSFMAFLARFRRYYHAVEVASGALLIIIGVLVLTGRMTWLSSQLGFLNRFVL